VNLAVVTSNANKATEIAAFFGKTLEVTHIALDIPEHRSEDVGKIASGKAKFAYDQLNIPLIVDDTGFSINALNGFPGPYAAYVLHTIGNNGILKLLEGVTERNARFTTAIALADDTGIRVFTGVIDGKITTVPRGVNGFGYDPIFEYEGRTFAEIPLKEKSLISHRALALASLRDWLVQVRHLSPDDTNG
jgi:XTP/dITP diphosphohydrolase